jgi:hypothetical protein
MEEQLSMEELKRRRKQTISERRSSQRVARLGAMSEAEYIAYAEDKAAKEKERRALLTPEQLERYKEAAKLRAQRSRVKRKTTIGK